MMHIGFYIVISYIDDSSTKHRINIFSYGNTKCILYISNVPYMIVENEDKIILVDLDTF